MQETLVSGCPAEALYRQLTGRGADGHHHARSGAGGRGRGVDGPELAPGRGRLDPRALAGRARTVAGIRTDQRVRADHRYTTRSVSRLRGAGARRDRDRRLELVLAAESPRRLKSEE